MNTFLNISIDLFPSLARCPQFPPVPPQCYKTADPSDKCCKKVTCDFRTTLTPRPNNQPTTAPTTPIIVVGGEIIALCYFLDSLHGIFDIKMVLGIEEHNKFTRQPSQVQGTLV